MKYVMNAKSLFLILIVLQISLAAAQGGPITDQGGNLNIWQTFTEGINSITEAEVHTVGDILFLVITPFVATFLLLRFIFKSGLQLAVENVGSYDRYGSNPVEDEAGKVASGLAILGGVMVAAFFPITVFHIMLLTVAAAPIFLLWAFGQGIGRNMSHANFWDNGFSMPSFGGGGDGDGGDIPDDFENRVADMEQDVENIQDQLAGIEGMEGRVNEALGQLREEIRGELQQETQEIRANISALREEVKDLDEFEKRLPQWVEEGRLPPKEAKRIEDLIEEVESLDQLEEKIEAQNEKIEQQEERIEENEEKIERLLEKHTDLEERVNSQLAEVLNNLITVARRHRELRDEINRVEMRLSQKEPDTEMMRDEVASLEQRANSLEEGVENLQEKASYISSEAESLRGMLESFMSEDPAEKFNELENGLESLEERISEVEAIEKKGEAVAEDEETKIAGIPEKLREGASNAINLEEKVLSEEEHETEKEGEIVVYEEKLLATLEEISSGETQIDEELFQEIARLLKLLESLARAIQQDKKEIQKIGQEEGRRHEVHEQELEKIFAILNNIDKNNTSMSAKEVEEYAEQAIIRLQNLKEDTEDKTELEMIRRGLKISKEIVGEEEVIEREAEAGIKESGQLAMEAQEIAGQLEGKYAQVFVQVEHSFEDARVILNPDTSKPGVKRWSIEQIEGWIWKQQEVLNELEQVKQRWGQDHQVYQEAEKMERGLIDVIYKICEVNGIEVDQFQFLL